MDKKIKDLMRGLSKVEAIDIKTREVAKEQLPNTFIKRGIEITILTQPVYERRCVKINLSARKNGESIPVDNPFYFFNPPIMIPTGLTVKVFDHPLNKEIDMPVYREDPQEALKEQIVQTIENLNNGNI